MLGILWGLAIFLIAAVIAIFTSGVRIIKPYEQGLLIVLGKYKRRLNSGFNWVLPLISEVIKIDLRTQVLDVPPQEVITRDNSPTTVDAIIYSRVVDPEKSYFEVSNYRLATISLAQTTLRSAIGNMNLDEVLYNRATINTTLCTTLDEATDPWGVKVEAVEIKEVQPSDRVTKAMEEQTSAEREKRAVILKSEGERRSKILVAEGEKQSRILEAEGVKQSKILEAEGEKLAQILRKQGESQGLRILSLGSATLDQKSLSVLSLNTLSKMADGQSTKIVFPFELTKLIEGASSYITSGRKIEEHKLSEYSDLEKIIGKTEEILGKIPTSEEIGAQIKKMKEGESEREEKKV